MKFNSYTNNYPDIYFDNNYGKACEISDKAIWEICSYKDLIYVYLKRPYKFNGITYYDLITPYGYSGYYYENKETFDEFIIIFRKEAIKRNYITEVVRQNPYININITNYDIIIKRKIFGINLEGYDTFELYINKTSKNNRRCYKKAISNDLEFKIEYDIDKFIELYYLTMDNLNANEYYYFNKEYFYSLKNIMIASIYKNNKLISSSIIFYYNKFLHYHLGGSLVEYRHLCPNNYLHCKIIEYGIKNKYNLYILGGGIKDNDSLFNFKKNISDTEYDYVIYKNILDKEIYNKINENNDNDYFPKHRK